MANIDFDNIKAKLKATFNVVADKTVDIAEKTVDKTKELASKTADKAKDTARIAKLSVEINGEKDTIKKAYLEIGKLYYEMHRDNPDGFFAQLCDEVSVANANIAAKEAEIAALKAGEDEIEVEIVECEEECECCCESTCEEAPAEEACCCEEAPVEETVCCCEEAPVEEQTECCCCEETPAEEQCECCCENEEEQA